MKEILLFLWFPFVLQAQTEGLIPDSLQAAEPADTVYAQTAVERAPYTAPPLKPLALREIPADAWDRATDGTDYSKDLPKPPKPPKEKPTPTSSPSINWNSWAKGLGSVLQAMAVLFALAAIIYGIYRMMQSPRNRKLARDGTEITLANLDEFIHETDLDHFLSEALAAANWSLAVRLYFLQTIKLLSEKEVISWSREKTNRDYLREMRNHRLSTTFRDVTRQYERIWYGNQPVSNEEFARLEPEFKGLLTGI